MISFLISYLIILILTKFLWYVWIFNKIWLPEIERQHNKFSTKFQIE